MLPQKRKKMDNEANDDNNVEPKTKKAKISKKKSNSINNNNHHYLFRHQLNDQDESGDEDFDLGGCESGGGPTITYLSTYHQKQSEEKSRPIESNLCMMKEEEKDVEESDLCEQEIEEKPSFVIYLIKKN